MLKEVHQLAEMLCKIRSGKFCDELVGIFDSHSNSNTNQSKKFDEDEYPDWDEDFFKSSKSGKPSKPNHGKKA